MAYAIAKRDRWLALGLLLTVVATAWVAHGTRETLNARFQTAIETNEALLKKRIEMNVALLHGLSGLFAAQQRVGRDDFAIYVDRLELAARYPQVDWIGLAEKNGERAMNSRQCASRRSIRPRRSSPSSARTRSARNCKPLAWSTEPASCWGRASSRSRSASAATTRSFCASLNGGDRPLGRGRRRRRATRGRCAPRTRGWSARPRRRRPTAARSCRR